MQSIIQEFGLPAQLEKKSAYQETLWDIDTKDTLARLEPDDETADNGSSLSDNEASCSTDSNEPHPAMLSFLAPAVASRRNSLRQMGQDVLGNMSMPVQSRVGSNHKVLAPPRQAPRRQALKEGTAAAEAAAQCALKHLELMPHKVRAPVSSPKGFGFRKEPAPLAPPKGFGFRQEPASACNLLAPPRQAPRRQALKEGTAAAEAAVYCALKHSELMPHKVQNCASFDIDVQISGRPMSRPLNPLVPVKKKPLFESRQSGLVQGFDPRCPLKKAVSEFFLTEPPCVVGC